MTLHTFLTLCMQKVWWEEFHREDQARTGDVPLMPSRRGNRELQHATDSSSHDTTPPTFMSFLSFTKSPLRGNSGTTAAAPRESGGKFLGNNHMVSRSLPTNEDSQQDIEEIAL